MTRIVQSSWFAVLIGGVLYLAATVLALQPSKFAGLRPAAPNGRSADDDPSWRFRNPEFNQWVAQIKEEKDALALREQHLTDLQNRLTAEQLAHTVHPHPTLSEAFHEAVEAALGHPIHM